MRLRRRSPAGAVELRRGRALRRVGIGRELDRVACHLHLPCDRVHRPDHHVARRHLGVGEHVIHPVDRRARHAGLFQHREPVRRRVRRQDRLELGLQRVDVGVAGGVVGEARVLGEVRPPQRGTERGEQRVVAGGDNDVTVGGSIGLEGCYRGMACPERPRHLAGGEVARERVLQDRHLAIEHRDVELHALARHRPPVERAVDADGGEEAGHDIADGASHPCRRAAGLAGQAHDAAHGLHHHVIGRPAGVGPGVAEARARRIDKPGEARMQRLPAIAEALHRAGAKVLDHHVGVRQQVLEDRAVAVVLEVEGDALLAAVDRHEVGGFSPR